MYLCSVYVLFTCAVCSVPVQCVCGCVELIYSVCVGVCLCEMQQVPKQAWLVRTEAVSAPAEAP